MKDSKFLSLGFKDVLKGLLMAILTPVFVVAQQSIESGLLTFDWKAISVAAIGGALAYFTKNFFTPSQRSQSIVGENVPVEKDEK
jgi:hypothetical protein